MSFYPSSCLCLKYKVFLETHFSSSNGTMNVLYGVGGGGIGLSTLVALVLCLIKNCKKSNSTSVTIIVQPCPE